MKKILLVAGSLLLFVSALFAAREQNYSLAGQLSLEIVPGPHFQNTGWFLIFPYTKGPQMAAWIENEQGTYLETIFVTQKAGTQKWQDAPQGRPESLPVWLGRSRGGQVDAVAVATTSAAVDTALNHPQALAPGKYVVYLEVNLSYDWNRVWAKDLPQTDSHYNGVNGQPSLVYRAEFEIGKGGLTVPMAPWGTGSPTGRDGQMIPGLTGLDTAVEILDSARVTVLH